MVLGDDFRFIIAGKSASGKSVFFKRVIGDRPLVVYSATWGINDDFDDLNVVKGYDDFDEFIAFLNNLIRERKSATKPYGRITIVLNDFIGATNIKVPELDMLFTMGRHLLINVVLITQALTTVLKPIYRTNMTHLAVTKITDSDVEKAYEFASGFKGKKEFIKFLKTNMVNYNVILFEESYESKVRIIRTCK